MCVLASNPFLVVIGKEHKKDKRKKSKSRHFECGSYYTRKQVPPQVQADAYDQVLVNPPAMTDGDVRQSLFQMSQAVITEAQVIKSQSNWEVASRENEHARTMSSRLRDFQMINPPMFFRSKVHEDPQEFLDYVYKVLFAMGVSTTDMAELDAYQLKDVS